MAIGESGKQAKADAAALGALAEQLKAAKAAYTELDAATKPLGPPTAIQAAKSAVSDLTTEYKRLASAKKEADAADAKQTKNQDKRTKDDAKRAKDAERAEAKRFKEQEKARAEVEKATGEEKKALEEGGNKAAESLKSGGEAVTKAAAAVAVSAAGLVAGAVKMGVESTAAADKQRRALGYLTRGYGESTGKGRGVVQGDVAYRVTLALAGETGTDPNTALERMRGLIDAKFAREPAEMLFRVSADFGAVHGEAAGEGLLSQLESIKRLDQKVKDARDPRNQRALQIERGGAQASALDKFAESGIKSSEVLGLLAQKGEDLRHVSLRLRRGKIDADEFAAAVAKVAGKDIGGAAGKGLDATVNRAKIGLTSLFEGWDLSPIDELGKKLDDALQSPAGADLKKGIEEIGKSILDLVKDVSKDDISSFFSSAASSAHDLAAAIRTARDMVGPLVDAGKSVGRAFSFVAASVTGGTIGNLEDPTGGGVAKRLRESADTAKGAEAAGKAFDDGLAKGIEDNAAKVKAAGARAAGGAAAGANEALGIKSPSRVAIQQGGHYGAGWEIGIDRSAGRVAGAARRLAAGVGGAGAALGASGGAGASGGLAGVGGGFALTYAPVINLPAGSTDETERRVRSVLADEYAGRFLPLARQWQRNAREQAQQGGG